VRDYIYVDDVAQAFLQGTANMDGISGRHFVIGSGVGRTFLEAITEVKQRSEIKTGNCVPIASIEPPSHLSPIEQRNFIADSSCYRELTGWQPRWSLPEGIDATIREFMAKENITQ
jgi:nucleoside-diphosphate-sugar epimerase